jgi:adenylate cyclase class 2
MTTRAVYDLLGVLVSLDELPYGNFIEIEGPDPATVHTISTMLGLNWEARVPESYTVLFEQIQARLKLDFNDLVFDNFVNLDLKPSDLNVIPADE